MNKPSKIALAFAFAAATISGVASAAADDNWVNPYGQVWKNGTNEYCWRNNFWTPATADAKCGLKKSDKNTPNDGTKVVFNADSFFDFDKAVLKPEGKQLLDQVAQQVQGINLETVIAVGHTDSIGSDAYNQKLSERRAAAVKTYLVSKGIDANRIYTEGKGKKQPIADNKTAAGRAKNRRVEIEIVGTRKK